MQLAQNFPMIFQTRSFAGDSSIKTVNIIEVGPRDGLQNETKILSVADKVELITKLSDCGIKDIECGSLVNYKLVPQMQGTPEVLLQLSQKPNNAVVKSILVPHISYLKQHASILPLINEIVLFVSASNTFNAKNINATVETAFERFGAIKQYLKTHPDPRVQKISIRGSISCCWECPYEGPIKYELVSNIIRKYLDEIQVDTVDICDTIGVARPETTNTLLSQIKQDFNSWNVPFTVHLHDTNGQAVNSALTAVELGYKHIHSSIAGLGGCPFSNKRVGNLDTVKLVEALHTHGYQTGISLPDLKQTATWVKKLLRE
jgi:hydroxymethylglutaryl-CoA lyase